MHFLLNWIQRNTINSIQLEYFSKVFWVPCNEVLQFTPLEKVSMHGQKKLGYNYRLERSDFVSSNKLHTCISIIDNQTFHCKSGKNRVSIGYVFFSVTIYLVVLRKKNNPDNFLQDFLKALSLLQFLVTDVLGECYVNTVNVTYHINGFT